MGYPIWTSVKLSGITESNGATKTRSESLSRALPWPKATISSCLCLSGCRDTALSYEHWHPFTLFHPIVIKSETSSSIASQNAVEIVLSSFTAASMDALFSNTDSVISTSGDDGSWLKTREYSTMGG